MSDSVDIVRMPLDSEILETEVFEIRRFSEDVLLEASRMRGHFTIKVDPLANKRLLHEFGYYYCDTLIEPYCRQDHFTACLHNLVSISCDMPCQELLAVAHGAFRHGRFHRDFNIDVSRADARYDRFLKESCNAGTTMAFLYDGDLAGFICYSGHRLLLHAMAEAFRGKGLAKYCWSAACRKLFSEGHAEITSSISAANLAVLNLYRSLGFRFRNPVDVYHRAAF